MADCPSGPIAEAASVGVSPGWTGGSAPAEAAFALLAFLPFLLLDRD
jgi:hypothetical protein